jgi:hypothetical protein
MSLLRDIPNVLADTKATNTQKSFQRDGKSSTNRTMPASKKGRAKMVCSNFVSSA